MTLTLEQLKALAIELSAAMPPLECEECKARVSGAAEAAPVASELKLHEDDICDAMDHILQGIAIMEMTWRTQAVNADDMEMFQRAALVTHQLLEKARTHLETVKGAIP